MSLNLRLKTHNLKSLVLRAFTSWKNPFSLAAFKSTKHWVPKQACYSKTTEAYSYEIKQNFMVYKKKTSRSSFCTFKIHTYNIWVLKNKKIKSVAYSSQGSHTGQLDFCNWLADEYGSLELHKEGEIENSCNESKLYPRNIHAHYYILVTISMTSK